MGKLNVIWQQEWALTGTLQKKITRAESYNKADGEDTCHVLDTICMLTMLMHAYGYQTRLSPAVDKTR